MYEVLDIVYGVPYTKEIEDAGKVEYGEDEPGYCYDILEEFGFEFQYTGHVPEVEPGYCGPVLWSGASWEVKVATIKALEPTPEQIAEAMALYEKFPDWLKAAANPPAICEVWSTS